MRPRFNLWVRNIPWRRARLPPPVFLPEEFHGQRSLAGYNPWDHKESDVTKQVTLSVSLYLSVEQGGGKRHLSAWHSPQCKIIALLVTSLWIIRVFWKRVLNHFSSLHSPSTFPGSSDGKASAHNAGDLGSIPGWRRSPGEGKGNPSQYSCLENPTDQGAWWATIHGVAKSRTQLSDFTSLQHLTYCLVITDSRIFLNFSLTRSFLSPLCASGSVH